MSSIKIDPIKAAKIKEILSDPNLEIYFIPSSRLKEIVMKGDNPMFADMPDIRKSEILSGYAIRIQNRMVIEFLNGELDEKNSFILSNGEIKVNDGNYKLLENGNSSS